MKRATALAWGLVALASGTPAAGPGLRPAVHLEVKHAADVEPLRAFLTTAARYAPALQPGPLGRSLGSALAIDLLDPASWAGTGLDPQGPASVVARDDATLISLSALKPDVVLSRAHEGLASLGTVESRKPSSKAGFPRMEVALGPAQEGARREVAAVAPANKRVLIASGSAPLDLLKSNLRAAAPPTEGFKGLVGELHLGAPGADLALAATPTRLAIDMRWMLGTPAVAPSGSADALSGFAPTALAWGRFNLTPAGLAALEPELASLLTDVQQQASCATCSPALLRSLEGELAGPVAFAITSVRPDQSGPSSLIDRAGLVSAAILGVVKDPAAAGAHLEAMAKALGATSLHDVGASSPVAAGQHWRLGLQHQQTVWIGLVGPVLYIANQPQSRDRALAALSNARGPGGHAGELHVDGSALSQSLAALSVLDAARTTDLAVLFGVAVEAGPLLKALGPVELTFDPDPSGARIRSVLSLPAS